MKKIIIGVATYGRSKYLKYCLESLDKLILPENHRVELILLDNNPKPQVLSILNSIEFPYPVHYLHEKERGIVPARNRILEEAVQLGADYLAFIDDDEMADANLLTQATNSLTEQISIVTGPCKYLFEQPKEWIKNSLIFSSKNIQSGEFYGTASTRNVLFDMRLVTESNLRFEKKLNWFGGSDTYLFIQAKEAGYRTFWNNEMTVMERIPESRSNLKWLLKRNLRMGSGRVHRERLQKSQMKVFLREIGVAFWFILKGILQTFLLFWYQHGYIRGIERTTRGIGILYALLGFSFKEYKTHHGH